MFKPFRKVSPGAVLTFLFLYVSIALPLFWFVHFDRGIVQAAFLAGVAALDFLLVLALQKFRLSRAACIVAGIGWGCVAVVVGGFFLCRALMGDYRCAPIAADYFAGKHVMFLVPHPDDDVALASGVAEQYVQAGSRVSMVFAIDGNGRGVKDLRAREALAAAKTMGIPAEDVYLLGYGDGWLGTVDGDTSVPHIYNSPDPDTVWLSNFDAQRTQGTDIKDCYLDLPYTRANFAHSIQSIVLDLRPDVIYCNDYDSHSDHRAVSLLFDEVMGQILRQEADYRPTVFKGFCYRTTWYAAYDFADSLNLISTNRPPQRETEVEINQYVWEDRVRVPLMTTGLNRLLTKTTVYDLLRIYRTQGAVTQTGAIANGDRVYWQRDTSSLLYRAEFRVGEEPTGKLNDFKLMDSDDVVGNTIDSGIQALNGPVTITLPEAMQAEFFGLYDDPSLDNQILAGYLELDNGNQIEFGELNNNGTVTYIPMPTDTFRELTLHVTEWAGDPGLTEVEAYATDVTAPAEELEYLMFVDDQDNFIYDYCMPQGQDSVTLNLYTYPHKVAICPDEFQITQTGSEACTYAFRDDGRLTVTCPQGESCQITVTYRDITCSMAFSSPTKGEAWLLETMQTIDFNLLHSDAPGSINDQISHYREFFNKMKDMLP